MYADTRYICYLKILLTVVRGNATLCTRDSYVLLQQVSQA